MAYIEKYVYDWVTARDRTIRSVNTMAFNKKGEVENVDAEAWVQLGRAEWALDRYVREWLGMEAVAGVEPTSGASKAPYPPRETAVELAPPAGDDPASPG